MGDLPVITIGMPTYNSSWSLRSCLDAIEKIDYPKDKIRIVFVDNNSEDETLEILKEFQKRNVYESVMITSEKSNIPEARNICISNSVGEYILFIDSDVTAPPNTINRMLQVFTSDPRIYIASFLYLTDTMGFLKKMIFSKQPKVPYATDVIMMGCAMVKKDLFNKVGLFNPNYSAGEDVNLAVRANKSGFISVIDPSEKPLHLTREKPVGILRQIIKYCVNLFKGNAHCYFMIMREYKPRYMINRLIFYLTMAMSIPFAIVGVIMRSMLLISPFIICYGIVFAYHFSKAYGKWRLINPVFFPLFGISLNLGILKEMLRYYLFGHRRLK